MQVSVLLSPYSKKPLPAVEQQRRWTSPHTTGFYETHKTLDSPFASREARLSVVYFYDLSLNPPPLPTCNSGLGIALDKSFPLGALPVLALPALPALLSRPLSNSTCGAVVALASLVSLKLPAGVALVSESLFHSRFSPTPRDDRPLRAKASPTVTAVDALSSRCILPLGSSRGVRRFPRDLCTIVPPDVSLDGADSASVCCICLHEGDSVLRLLRREGRLRLCTQLLDPGRLCIDARLNFEGEGGVPSSFSFSLSRERGLRCRCRPPQCPSSDSRGRCCDGVSSLGATAADDDQRRWSSESSDDPTLFWKDRSSSAERKGELAPSSRSIRHSLHGLVGVPGLSPSQALLGKGFANV